MAMCGEQTLIKSREEEITFRVLVEVIRDVWRLLTKSSNAGRNDGKTALGSVQPGAFVGNCYNSAASVDTRVFNARLKGLNQPAARNAKNVA